MSAILKYQELINQQNLSVKCPYENCLAIDTTAYRWVKSDFSDGQSFLPNLLYDKNRGRPPRKNHISDVDKCGLCSLSFFESIEASSTNAAAIGGVSKVNKLLGYTHLAEGSLTATDGLSSQPDDKGHFEFFEFDNVNLESKFNVIAGL